MWHDIGFIEHTWFQAGAIHIEDESGNHEIRQVKRDTRVYEVFQFQTKKSFESLGNFNVLSSLLTEQNYQQQNSSTIGTVSITQRISSK